MMQTNDIYNIIQYNMDDAILPSISPPSTHIPWKTILIIITGRRSALHDNH